MLQEYMLDYTFVQNSVVDHLSLCLFNQLLPVHRYSVDFFHILVLQKYLVLTESRIPIKQVLGCMSIVAISVSSHGQTH